MRRSEARVTNPRVRRGADSQESERGARNVYLRRKGDINGYMPTVEDASCVIDALHGTSARYCHHSSGPNFKYATVKLECSDVVVVFVSSLVDIRAGEEITVGYNWGGHMDTPNIFCECGAQTCFGRVGVRH